jgi:SagB-type dehydrogenase family enzyme
VKGAVPLPEPPSAEADVLTAVRERRSRRDYIARPVKLTTLAAVVRDTATFAPVLDSRGLTEVGVIVHAVKGVAPGSYRYLPDRHALGLLRAGSLSRSLANAGLGQGTLSRAAFVLAVSMRTDRVGRWYGARDYRVALLTAGLVGGSAYLSAGAHGLGVCGIGAFLDAELKSVISGSGSLQSPLYLIAVGSR